MRLMFLVALCVACGGEDFEAKEPVCDPGKTAACTCAGTDEGSQVCAVDGLKWGACECEGGSGGTGGGGGTPDPVTVGPGAECDGTLTVCSPFAQCVGVCVSDRGGDCVVSLHCSGALKCAEDLHCTDKQVIPLGGVCGDLNLGQTELCEAPGECWLVNDDEAPRCVVR